MRPGLRYQFHIKMESTLTNSSLNGQIRLGHDCSSNCKTMLKIQMQTGSMTTMSFKLPDLSLQHGIVARIWDTHTRSPPSPGSSVHSSRGALREMPLRFLRTLLMTFPTPPDPEPAGCCCCRDLTYALDRRPAGMKRSCLIGYGVRTNHHPMCPLCGPRYTTF